jgi:general L-amino acid transport system substrate-binding protein
MVQLTGQKRRKLWAYLVFGIFLLTAVLPGGLSVAAVAGTLETIQARGSIACGVEEDSPGFSVSGTRGWTGLGVDFCRAIAAAVLGDAGAVKFVPLTRSEQYTALQSKTVDILPASTVWTLSYEADLGLRFAGVLFFDGQGFMVRRGDAVASILEMSGATICITTGSRQESAVADYFKSRKMKYQLVVGTSQTEIIKAYAGGSCTVVTGEISQLALHRSRLPKPSDHFLLPELASNEPLGPVVRQGDELWFSIVRWVLMALISAEEQGLSSGNVDTFRSSELQDIQRLLGVRGGLGLTLGLRPEWAYQAIKQTGNYGELFDRNLGAQSSFKLERGLNQLWTKGGLLYAAPLR